MFKLFGKSGARHVSDTMRGAPSTKPGTEALNTAKKIDAIESEMATEFNAVSRLVLPSAKEPQSGPLVDRCLRDATPALQSAIEEAAMLHATAQSDLALQLLVDVTQAAASQSVSAVSTASSEREQLAWRMMFDLCQLDNLQQQFERFALVYANRFETSPPQWNNRIKQDSRQDINQPAPSVSFRGKLDANSMPLLERIQNLADSHAAICIECSDMTEVDVQGCAHFLHVVQQISAKNRQISVTGAIGFLEKIRALIEPGRRDHNEAAWLLLIELLRLMNNEKQHEEVCLNYCVTYEVSPPAFVPPPGFTRPIGLLGRHFLLPRIITAPLDPLWDAINQHAATAKALILDASQLARIDFTVAAPLVEGLLRLHASKPVELRHINDVVGVLLQLVGGKDKLLILPRRL